MHELSIASAILEAVRDEAAKRPGTRVTKVGVRIGALAGVDPDALTFGFDALVKDTEMASAGLDIEWVPRRHRCLQCEKTFEVTDDGFGCPSCGSSESVFVSGDELNLAYLEVEG
jgi:hydrogenase nickel incorporation protein HypA/HybF